MTLIESRILFKYLVLAVFGLTVTRGQVFSRSSLWDQYDHGGKIGEWGLDQKEWTRPKAQYRRSTPDERAVSVKCGTHYQDPIDSVFLKAGKTLPGEWPWLVGLFHSNDKDVVFRCSATLIDDRYVVSAAHCLYNPVSKEPVDIERVSIIVGTRNLSSNVYNGTRTHSLAAMYVHEEYDTETKHNDIALMALKKPVAYSNLVKPVCLWEGRDDLEDLENRGQYGTVVGWGDSGNGEPLETPQRIDVPVASAVSCRASGPPYYSLTYKSFCAGWNNQGVCNGFGGSGLYIERYGRWMLRGLLSNYVVSDSGDASCNLPAVYTDVGSYGEWISETLFYWSQVLVIDTPPPTSFEGETVIEEVIRKPTYPVYMGVQRVKWTQQCHLRDEVNALVTGGLNTKEGEWPWHVAIYHNEHKGSSSSIMYKCGGSLISDNHVLTAAHCVTNKLTKSPVASRSINIYLGTHNIRIFSEGVQIKLVNRMKIHPEYNPETQYKDIAVLKLSSPVDITDLVKPVCLWPKEKVDLSNIVGKDGSVVGWGYDEYGLLADELMLAKLPVVSEVTCLRSHAFYQKYTNNVTYCAGLLQETSVCNGDSGGGMVFKLRTGVGKEEWFLRGIVSLRPASDNLCDASRYAIFTDVAKYLDWIKNTISGEL